MLDKDSTLDIRVNITNAGNNKEKKNSSIHRNPNQVIY